MPRFRDRVWRYESTIRATLDLLMGPTDAPGELTVEQLDAAWAVERDSLMDHCHNSPTPGWRPWAWWQFERGEEMPASREAEALRLAELGELTDEERAAIAQRANEAGLRLGTGAERISAPGAKSEQRPDRTAVGLYEAMEAALQEATS